MTDHPSLSWLLVLALLVAGCAQTPQVDHSVMVVRKVAARFEKSMVPILCKEPGSCSYATIGTGSTLLYDILTPEEFTFRYQNDPAFKASIQSYEFR